MSGAGPTGTHAPVDIQALTTTRGLLLLAAPLAAGAGVTYAMQFVNRLFLSWYSPEALAASLPAGMVAYTLQCFFFASAGYLGAFAAQHHGAGEADEAGAMAWPMLWLALVAGVVALALVPFSHAIFSGFGAEPAVTADMAALGAWYFAETGPAVVVAGLAGFCGGIGRTGLVAWLSAGICVLSIILNFALISGRFGMPALGIHGAGIATLVATVIGAGVWLGWFFAPSMRRAFGTWRMRNADMARLARYARFGLPRGGTEVLEMLAMLLFTTGITHLGTEALAASNIALSLYLLVFIPLTGFGQGITIAVGQAMGAGRPDWARAAVRRAMILVAVALMLWAVACWCCPRLLLSIYVGSRDADPARWERILALGLPLLTVLGFMGLTDGVHLVYRFAVQGAGDTRWPLAVLTTCAVLLLGIPVLTMALVVPAEAWTRWDIQPLTVCWLMMVGYTTVIAMIMAWRFHRGPWATMSIRR